MSLENTSKNKKHQTEGLLTFAIRFGSQTPIHPAPKGAGFPADFDKKFKIGKRYKGKGHCSTLFGNSSLSHLTKVTDLSIGSSLDALTIDQQDEFSNGFEEENCSTLFWGVIRKPNNQVTGRFTGCISKDDKFNALYWFGPTYTVDGLWISE